MFLIAGVQPKAKTIAGTPHRCPNCGRYQTNSKRIDHYFSLFFIPIVRVKKGEPFLMCDHCQAKPKTVTSVQSCKFCHKPVEKSFRYCPYCGKPLNS